MALNTGIIVTQGTSQGLALSNQLPTAIFGTTSTGTIAAGELTKITSQDQAATILGAGTSTDTLPNAVAVLQRYGCGDIYAVKLVGADEISQATDLVTQLDLLSGAIATVGEQPRLILFPTFSTDEVVTKALTVATSTLAVVLANFPEGEIVADAITARATTTGLGTKSTRLVVSHGYLYDSTTPSILEGLDLHLAGAIANRSYGNSPLGYELKGIDSVDVAMTFGLSSETDSPEMLNDAGIVSVNVRPDGAWIIWGDRNSSYIEGSADILTFINAVRARDEISRLAKVRAAKMLGQPSNYSTASLLTESYRTMLGDAIAVGDIKGYTTLAIDTTKTDYAAFKIWHDLIFQVWLPLELVGVNVYVSLVN